jgi:putative oxidoreductase
MKQGFIPASWSGPLQSLLRIVAAFLYLQHGTQKLFGVPHGMGTVPLFGLMGLAGIIETVGGVLLLVGFGTRIVAFIMSGEMAFAYFMRHFPNAFLPIENHGELAVVFCFIFLYFAAAGPGPWSIDAAQGGRG